MNRLLPILVSTCLLAPIPAMANPHVVGPTGLDESSLRQLIDSEQMLHEQPDSATKAVFYGDDRIILWFDRTTGGFLRGVWLLEDGQPVTSRDSNGGQGPVNLLFCQGHRVLIPLGEKVLGQPKIRVTEKENDSTKLDFSGQVFDGTRAVSDYRVSYTIQHDRRVVDARFQFPGQAEGNGPVWVVMDTMGGPDQKRGELESRPVSGLTCGAWNVSNHSMFRLSDPSHPLDTFFARTDGVSILQIADGSSDSADPCFYRVRGSDLRRPWVGVYNGNWDEGGYRFGVDYSIAREFVTPDRVEYADFIEVPWRGAKGSDYDFARSAVAVANTGGGTFQWEERLHVNRGDYQTYLRKGGY